MQAMLLNVTRSSMPDFSEYTKLIEKLWDSRWLTNCGVYHNELEESLKKYLNAARFMLFSNGHTALELGFQALGIKGEVITTPFTFISTTNAIKRMGLTPVFCDINPIRLTIDPMKIESLITEQTTAIAAVHVYGIPCDAASIEGIAKKHNLRVIYDAAHAFGVEYNGKSIAECGDYSMFSFHATKVFHTAEGGGGAFSDEKLYNRLQKLRNFGNIIDEFPEEQIGCNAKMSEFHAALGLCNLRHIDDEIAKRKLISDYYDSYFKNKKDISIFPDIKNLKRNYAYYPIIFNDTKTRDKVFKNLAENGINARKYFYPPTNDAEFFKRHIGETPIAESISNRILCLPIYADLEMNDVDRICKQIGECYDN
jgi:dTDP-4-amino-4,6-dideoxygalactose transaminase